jgi:hypothetical protein
MIFQNVGIGEDTVYFTQVHKNGPSGLIKQVYHIFISNNVNFAHTLTPEVPQRYLPSGQN